MDWSDYWKRLQVLAVIWLFAAVALVWGALAFTEPLPVFDGPGVCATEVWCQIE